MEAEDFPFEGLQAAGGGFNQKEIFAGGFDFSLPAVDRFYRGDLDVDAGGEVFLEEGAGDFAGFRERVAGNEDEAKWGGHGVAMEILAEMGKEEKDLPQRTQRATEGTENVRDKAAPTRIAGGAVECGDYGYCTDWFAD